jgi:hypothetical protein
MASLLAFTIMVKEKGGISLTSAILTSSTAILKQEV